MQIVRGDCLDIMQTMPEKSVDLVYADPPFFTGKTFKRNEYKFADNNWGTIQEYAGWLSERIIQMKRVLRNTGSIYVHLDDHAVHYAKVAMDTIFGYSNFKNHITWKRALPHNDSGKYGRVSDHILYYTVSRTRAWNPPHVPYSPEYIRTEFNNKDERGYYKTCPLTTDSQYVEGYRYRYKGHDRNWRITLKSVLELERDNRIHMPKKRGGIPRYKKYISESKGVPMQDIWLDITNLKGEYPTQKPEELLDRIIGASSYKGDMVLDPFCGSSTTGVVAQRLGRNYIGIDVMESAVKLSRERLSRKKNDLYYW